MSYLEKNLKLLHEKQPALAALMGKEMDSGHIEIVTAASGLPSARVITSDGRQVILHDLKDPVAKAKEHAHRLDLSGNNGTVLLGFGLGYLAREIVTAMDEAHVLIICEADPALLRVALQQVDLEAVLKSKRVKLLVGKEIDLRVAIAGIAIKFLTSKISLMKFHPSFAVDPATYGSWEKKAKEATLTLKISANTILLAGREMAGNILANTPGIIRSPGVKNLFNRFTAIPAIVVGAGPSLEKNAALLREVNNKALIIAVDRSLGLLLPLGITPHIVPSIDYSSLNYREKYAPLHLEEKFCMVSSQTVYPKITQSFWGPQFSIHQGGKLSESLSYYWGDKGTVPAGLHVGHLAFCLARALGCNPIILTGMDLAFTGDKLHAQNIESSIDRTPGKRLSCEDIFGSAIKTDPAFMSFVAELEEEIRKTVVPCIDATEGGAKKAGTIVMRLKDALDEYCTDDHPEIRTILEEESFHREPVKDSELIRDFRSAETSSKKMKRSAKSTLALITKLKRMKKDGLEGTPAYSALSRKAEKMTIRIGEQGRIISLLENYNFANILFMGKEEIKGIDAIQNPFEKLDRQLERAETYYGKLIEALDPFISDLRELVKRLSLAQSARRHLAQSQKTWKDYLDCAQAMIACENHAEAEEALRTVLKLNPECNDAHYHLGTICYRQNRFKSAAAALNRAKTHSSHSRRADELLRECQRRSHLWEEKCEKMRQQFLITTPAGEGDERQKLLSAGNFYFQVKNYGRAKKEYEKVLDGNPTLSEAHYHLGHTFFALNDFEGGVAALTRALECCPDNPAIYRDLALIAMGRGLTGPAERFLLKALEIKPDDLELRELLGRLYFRGGFLEKATV